MYRKNRFSGVLVAGLLMSIMMFSLQATAAEVMVVGMVNDSYQIVTDDGETYAVADTEVGNEMLDQVGKKVEITGTIEGDGDDKVLTVASYRIVDEQ